MSTETKNYKLFKYEDNDIADLRFLHDSMDTIDKGLTLDMGTSTGTGNDYVLNLGSISLSSANKGISFKFWADKDSTGAVTINGTYNLVKDNGNPIKNIKRNAPYVITYDGGTNFFLSSGGSNESDSTTVGTDGSKVLAGTTFVGSDGEVHTGQIPVRTAVNTTLKAGQSVSLESGYYKDKSTIKAETLATTMSNTGVTLTSANQLVNGVKAVDKNGNVITGTATIESLGGYKYVSGTVDVPLFYSKRGPSDSYIWSNETITLKEALNNKYKNIICYSISYIGCEDYNAGQSSRKMRDISAYGIIFKDMRKGMMCPRASMSITQYNEINFDTETREIFDDFTIMSIGNGCPIAKYWNNPADGATVTYRTMKYGIICHDA